MFFMLRTREGRDFFDALDSGPGCLILLVLVIAFIAMLSAIGRALSRVAPENRLMEPEQVWLNLIPVVNLIWMPVTVDRVGESFRNELIARGRNMKREGYAKSAGFIALFLMWAALLVPMIGVLFFVFSMIYAGVYWILVNGYGRRLKEVENDYAPPVDEGW